MILDKIVEKVKIRLAERKKELTLEELIIKVNNLEKKENRFFNSIKKSISIIAEVKKASPSKSIINHEFNYLDIAKKYEIANVSAISVLTEEDYFLGSIKYLKEIREVVSTPILRKDFIIDEYQIYESKLINADCILLIAKLLDYDTLKRFYELANSLNLEAIFEVHNKEEIDKVLKVNPKIIGINNRDLNTFEVDINNSINLKKYINNKEILLISESGISSKKEIKVLKDNGFNAVLIGETFMRSSNIVKEIRDINEN